MQQENMKTLESLEDFRHFSEKELEIRFAQLKKRIVPADETIREQAEKHWGRVAKPLGSLGVLEEDIIRIAAASGSLAVSACVIMPETRCIWMCWWWMKPR